MMTTDSIIIVDCMSVVYINNAFWDGWTNLNDILYGNLGFMKSTPSLLNPSSHSIFMDLTWNVNKLAF